MTEPSPETIDAFIARWEKSGGHERGSGQHFLLEFCDLLGLEKPAPPVAENERNAYTFERRVDRRKPDGTSAPNWIDLYKSAHFVLETKQGVNPRRDKSDPDQPLLPDLAPASNNKSLGHGHRGSSAWDKALDRAHAQGERYIHLLPADEGRPPFLIVTGIYNVLEKLSAEEPLTDKDKKIHDDGLVTILKQIHDDLDEAVLEAYGWSDLKRSAGLPPASSSSEGGRDAHAPFEQELLKRLVALNHERAAEEKRGLIRWLRPEYQCGGDHRSPQPEQKEIDLGKASSQSKLQNQPSSIVNPTAWPSTLSEQVTAIQKLLPTTGPDSSALAAHFGKRTKARIQQITEILKTLEALGKL